MIASEVSSDAGLCKEAYLKAIGEGIKDGLDHFGVTVDAFPRLSWVADLMQNIAQWHFHDLVVDKDYIGAIVMAGEIRSIRSCRWTTQLA